MALEQTDLQQIKTIVLESYPHIFKGQNLSAYEEDETNLPKEIQIELKKQRDLIWAQIGQFDKRFEDMQKYSDKRFEEMQNYSDKRFEDMNRRFAEMQNFMEKRFEQVDKRFEQVDKRFEEMQNFMDKRFEQIDKRFEQVDKRFEDMQKYMDSKFKMLLSFMSLGFTILAAMMTIFKFVN